MTLGSNPPYSYTSGNGTTKTFTFDFRAFLTSTGATGVEVSLEDNDPSSETYGELEIVTEGVEYSVTLDADPNDASQTLGGTVEFVTAPTALQNVLILSKTDLTQQKDYSGGGTFPAASHEDAIDKLTRVNQEQQLALDMALRVPIFEAETFNPVLPKAAIRANKAFTFDSNGDIIMTDAITQETVDEFFETADDVASAKTAAEAAQSAAESAQAAAETARDEAEAIVDFDASAIVFDPSGSSLSSTDVDAALKELDTDVTALESGKLEIGAIGMFSVVTYGAIGDGATDDTAAIQAAIDAAAAAGRGCVYFPDKTFLISDTLKISSNYVGLRGTAWGASRILATTDITAIQFQRPTPTSQWGYGGFVQDLLVECSAVDPTAGIGVLLDAYGHSLISNVYIIGFWRGLVCLGNPSTVLINCVDITQGANNTTLKANSACCVVDRREIVSTNPNAVQDPADDLYYHEPNSIFFKGCNFRPSDLGACDTLLIGACDGLYASGSYFGGGDYQTIRLFASQSTLNIGGLIFSGCRIDPKPGVTEYGILYDENTALSSEYTGGHQWIGCTVGGAAITAVWIEGVVATKPQNVQFNGCKFKKSDDNGIVVTSGDNISFTGCSFEDNNQDAAGTYADINLTGGTNLMFNGCTFKGSGYRGVRSAGTTNVSRVSVIGCRFQDADADNCIYLAHTDKNDTIANNDCDDTRSIASSSTLIIPAVFDTFYVTGTANISNIYSVNRRCAWEGRRVTLIFEGALTVSSSGNIGLSSDYTTSAGDVLVLVFVGDAWHEVSRT